LKSQWGVQYLLNAHNDIENGITSQIQSWLHGDISPARPST